MSGLLSSKGAPGKLLDMRFQLVTSEEQIDELRRVLGYKRLQRYIRPEQARGILTRPPRLL
ncbi:MAG: hypothetical protein CSA62_05340 [Planctomycetota bacterium]|nr:MAG: hypothetical protein CSA62_05340 [Planctomycetota bacterium]